MALIFITEAMLVTGRERGKGRKCNPRIEVTKKPKEKSMNPSHTDSQSTIWGQMLSCPHTQ